MLVVHVAPTLFGEDGLYGGGERYPLELGRALAAHLDCRLVTFGSRAARHRDPSGLEIIVLPRKLNLKRHPAHPVGAGLAQATRGADVVHVHHMRSTPGRAAALLATVRGQARVVTDHGLGGGGWAGLLPKMFDHFATVSRHSAEVLRAPAARTTVIYGGADATRFTPGDTRREGLLFVGRITPHKGIDRLLRALPEGVPLTIAGTSGHDPRGPERFYPRLLSELARDKNVTFAGAVAESDLPELYRSVRALVLPSVHETCYGKHVAISELLGLAAIEAMACGTPVVCSRVGGLPEVVEDGVSGIIVEPGDVASLHDAIRHVLDPGTTEVMGRAAREIALHDYTWQRCAERCLDVYEAVSDRAAT